jgi:Caudovirus prohead serine protease
MAIMSLIPLRAANGDATAQWAAWIEQRASEIYHDKLPGLMEAMAPVLANYLKEQLAPLRHELTGLREKLLAPASHLRAFSVLENVKAIEEGGGLRRISGTCSSFKTDRVGDRVSPRGAIIADHTPLLFQHDPDSAIGWCDEITPHDESISFKATIAKVQEDGTAGSAEVAALCDRVWTHCRAGTIRGVSIGFAPVPGGSEPIPGGHGVLFSCYHLLEISIVSIPTNVDCSLAVIKALDDPAARTVLHTMRGEIADALVPLQERCNSLAAEAAELRSSNAALRERIAAVEPIAALESLFDEMRELRNIKGLTWRGAFKSDDDYTKNDIVLHKGASWICVTDKPRAPGDGVDNGWQLMAKGGRDGLSIYDLTRRAGLTDKSEREWLAAINGSVAAMPARTGAAEPRSRTGTAEPRR